jgi:hypothetical protein
MGNGRAVRSLHVSRSKLGRPWFLHAKLVTHVIEQRAGRPRKDASRSRDEVKLEAKVLFARVVDLFADLRETNDWANGAAF